jgi:cysteine synthase A
MRPAADETMTTLRPQLLYGLAIGVSFSLSTLALAKWYYSSKPSRAAPKSDSRLIQLRSDEIVNGVTGLIGTSEWLYFRSMAYLEQATRLWSV